MNTPKVQTRGQVTLPVEIRRSAGVAPGDAVVFSVMGPGDIRIRTVNPMSLKEFKAKYPVDPAQAPDISDWPTFIAEAEAEQANRFVARMQRADE